MKNKWKLSLGWKKHAEDEDLRAGVGLDLSQLDLDTDEGVDAMLMHLRACFRSLYHHMCQKFDRFPQKGEIWREFEERTGISLSELEPPLTFAEVMRDK